jgi:DNA repair protein RecN (Recombination protein N)
VLSELYIENLAVIPKAELKLLPGLNVITGETGAGKTILAHAISLLLGVRADSGLIRPGADEATVEAIFKVPDGIFAEIAAEFDIPEEEDLIVRRRISRDGRSRAFLGGRATTLAVLEQVTGRLLAFSAQHEQRRLMLASRQLDILDDYVGMRLVDLRDEFQILYDRRIGLKELLDEQKYGSQEREREVELLKFQLAEIEMAGLSQAEDEELDVERQRLLRSQELREATGELAAILSGDSGGAGLMDALSHVLARLQTTTGIDSDFDDLTARLKKSFYELEETGRSARDYSESVMSDPARLAEVEERLDLISQLKRKYGNSIEEVLAHAVKAADNLKLLTGVIEAGPALDLELAEIDAQMIELAAQMRELRIEAASSLEAEAGGHLRDLAFQDCGFEIRLSRAEGDDVMDARSLKRSGGDSAEFKVRLNPGMPPSPLKETASGGELSRIMLAIKSAVSSSRESATLVFDEIDAGIGGETGAAVGAKLKSLSGNSQTICITHLPQIAGFADAHFSVSKSVEGGETVTAVTRLEDDEIIVDELCRMMGSKPDDLKARGHVASLRTKAAKA